MAKESMKAREVKRAKLVAKYAAKRAALKEIVNKSNDPVEAYEDYGSSQRLHPPLRSFSYPIPRNGF